MTVLLLAGGIVILYLMAIMPRMVKRPDYNPLQGFYYAHRGLHDNQGEAPENSLAAFLKAVEAGYGIELDVQLTADKIPVVFHDNTLKRVCRMPGGIQNYTYEELQQFFLCRSGQRIPKLLDVLKLVEGRVPLIIEIKSESVNMEVCRITDMLLQKYSGVYCVESFNPMVLLWYRRNHDQVIRGQLSTHYGIKSDPISTVFYWLMQELMFNFLAKPDFIAYDHRYAGTLSRQLCRKLYRCLSVAWTIRSPEELEENKEKFDLFIFEGVRG